ncbi:hypothetical protein GCM10011511_36060 [Puia dinghuensis]|uniref:DUF433 domain-containing protein n=1 Tax=Puia dinghuensis TaxID=1792502 RepID=A0A8J2XU72_9BACT|nr:hypothetical protein GCM10011511_36060 [Puia dinghuensis]
MKEYWGNRFGSNQASLASWGKGREKSVHFFTLIEFYVFFQLRKRGVSAQSISRAHEIMGQELNTTFPFANSEILTDGKKIFYSPDGDVIINADKSKQINFKSIIEQFCHKIDFDKDQNALRYWPLGKEKNIVVDPHHQLGQPTIKNTNILAGTIYSMYTAGEKISFISTLYDVPESDVKASIEFFKKAA